MFITITLRLKQTKIRLSDKCSSWFSDQKSVCNVSASGWSSFWPPVISQLHHHAPPALYLLWCKAQVDGDAGEHGSDVCPSAGGLAGREDGQVQHNPGAWAQLLDTYSGQGPVTESLI